MTEKRYYAHKHLLKENEVHDKRCHRFMGLDETVEHLNNEYWKYKQLKDENEGLKDRIDNYNDAFKKLQDLTERKINENEQLKNELRIYRKLANCSNCQYHNYDTLFGGDDEYEVCDKGNDVTDGICKDWREL